MAGLSMHSAMFWFAALSAFEAVAIEEYELDLYGGHSSDFIDIDIPVSWSSLHDVDVMRQRRMAETTPGFTTDEELHHFIDSYREPFEELKTNLKQLFVNEWVSLTYRIKSFSSLKEKLRRKEYTLDRIHDVMGFRLMMATVSEVQRVHALVKKNATKFLFVEEERCYGMCVDAKARYREDGYRRIHLLVTINNKTKWAEVQLGTPYTSMWSDWNHEFLYKGKFANTKDTSILDHSKEVADYLYRLDVVRDGQPFCPPVLKTASAKEEFPPQVYQMLHQQPNLCFLWQDIFLSQPLVLTNGATSCRNILWHSLVVTVIICLVGKIRLN